MAINSAHAWAIFISGQGSNMSALMDLRDECPMRLVVVSRPGTYGELRARRSGIPVKILDKEVNWLELVQELKNMGVTHIFLAGFMKIIPPEFLKAWGRPILNIHPSLLPKYPGLNSIEKAYNDGEAIGVTVHQVTPEVDGGAIVLQQCVYKPDTLKDYSLDEAEFTVHTAEYQLVRRAMRRASCWT